MIASMSDDIDTSPPSDAPSEYRVLARKYRPTSFEDLIGQDALVNTLRNAFAQNRVHHAFVLTGVRGVGKTTTARIIAKGLNCIGPDGSGGPTMQPCGVCSNCVAIAEDRHVDVLEMDAASRTGVDDVREIIDSVRYRPANARYKVYIIDEVHMLTKNAFNALLKTLEEPPEHVKFIFATTEIRKVPVTILSRCQRFDLRRIDVDRLSRLFTEICEKEKVEADEEALRLVARAADGSARDGLSMLDQAIALAEGPVTATLVADMLGLVDRERVYDLFEAVIAGEVSTALDIVQQLHAGGADPVVMIRDLMELTHQITRMKAAPKAMGANDLSEAERERGRKLAETVGVPTLTRAWQMLAKGLSEVQSAPVSISAVEMVLIRLCHAAELPDPADLVRFLNGQGGPAASGTAPALAPATPNTRAVASAAAGSDAPPPQQVSRPAAVETQSPAPSSLQELVDLFHAKGEPILAAQLTNSIHLVSMSPGAIEMRVEPGVDRNLAAQLTAHLQNWTGRDWNIRFVDGEGAPTLRQQRADEAQAKIAEAETNPVVARVLELFPGAKVEEVIPLDVDGEVDDTLAHMDETGDPDDLDQPDQANEAMNP